ncbi:MAG TPA: phosphotransferase [Actinomycetota bacterium]|nr:phosphotransferase [Actinomycetota bacterium]
MTDARDLSRLLPPDPGLPGAGGLFGPSGPSAVRAFLRRRGWDALESRPVQALYRPGASCVVRYRVRATTPAGDPRVLSVSAETRATARPALAPPDDFASRYGLADPVQQIDPYLVWAFPYDPSLEGLADAAWGPSVRDILRASGEAPAAVSVEPLRYRPRRRAVFRYVALHRGSRRSILFGKTLRGSAARRWMLHRPRRASRARLDLALPTASHGRTLLVPSLEGRSLRDLLLGGGSLPAPERVAAVLDDLPGGLGTTPPGDAPDAGHAVRLAGETLRLLERVASPAMPAAERVAAAVAVGAEGTAVAPRLVHGDLYEAQLFVGRGYRLGLIDLDGVGLGDPAMDAANFCAHLVALALSVPRAADRLLAYRSLLRRAFVRRLRIDPSELAWREGLAMLLLATGPFRLIHPEWPDQVRRRSDVAVRLIDSQGAS